MSILGDIRKMLGILDNEFDGELCLFINSALSDLVQLGPVEQKWVADETLDWSDIATDLPGDVREFVYLRVRLAFDPPANGFTTTSFKQRLEELAWRINIHLERYKKGADTWK